MELDDRQLAFLDKMDQEMDSGFKIYGEVITASDVKQKATFVSMNLLRALQQEDTGKIAVSCAYLATRMSHFNSLNIIQQ